MSTDNKKMVVRFYDELFGHGNLAVIDEVVATEYVNHNPHAPDGPEALRRFVTGFRAAYPRLRYTIERVIAEDDLVLLFSHAVSQPDTRGQAIVDIFRVRGGKIVEHWDVIQPVPETSVNGNDMFSTLTPQSPADAASTAVSKRVAVTLFEEVIGKRDPGAFDRYASDSLYQHNPTSLSGAAAAKAQFTSVFKAHPNLTVSVKRVIAEGDYVAFHHHFQFTPEDRGFAVVDIFRVQHGKVVEHWDAVQPVPDKSANANTMF